MRVVLLGIILACLALAVAGRAEAPLNQDTEVMVQWYALHFPDVRSADVRAVGGATKEFADLLGLSQDDVQVMLCMWHRESAFSPVANDSALVGWHRRSLGICQTRHSYFKSLRAFWRKRGVRLGAFKEPRTQVAFGVAEFYIHLQEAHHSTWDAVRRYNGSGPGARRHARKVFNTYCVVFKHPHWGRELK